MDYKTILIVCILMLFKVRISTEFTVRSFDQEVLASSILTENCNGKFYLLYVLFL